MAPRPLTAAQRQSKAQREVEDLHLVIRARNGDDSALDALMRRYTGFVRLKASSYFIAGGESEDLIQEGLIGLYKAVRDFRSDKETSFRSFAELCITRQIITAIKTATRFKHAPLNTYVSFSQTPAGQDDSDVTLGDALAGPERRRSRRLRDLDRGAPEPRLHARHRTLAARVRRAAPLPRRPLLRADGGGARLRHEDDRQRAPAREAQGARAPDSAPGPALIPERASSGRRASSLACEGARGHGRTMDGAAGVAQLAQSKRLVSARSRVRVPAPASAPPLAFGGPPVTRSTCPRGGRAGRTCRGSEGARRSRESRATRPRESAPRRLR